MQNVTKEDEAVLLTIQRNDVVGRYAVASCDFSPGDIIFSETPFAFGPKADSPPLCLGCYLPADGTVLCSLCKWPVCEKGCEITPAHRDAECRIFSEAQVHFQPVEDSSAPCLQYECITPLRVLLAKLARPERWNREVKEMEAHNTLRKDKPIWKFNQINIVNYLRGPCKLKNLFDEDLIHTVCGILESNAFEARSTSGHPIRCLYPNLAILSHNCISNISHSIVCTGMGDGDDFRVTVRAAIDIQMGEELFSSYTYSLWPTIVRRAHLKESKYFDCCCARCSDPTEMGTHMSTLKCVRCNNGMVTSSEPLNSAAEWKCSSCKSTVSSDNVRTLFASLQDDIDVTETYRGDIHIEISEKLLRKYDRILHHHNAYCCILRSSLIHAYGRLENHAKDADNNCFNLLTQRKIEFCKSLLKVLDIIEPGYSRIRGLTLYELYMALIQLAAIHQENNPDKEALRAKLQELTKVLGECVNILTIEPVSTLEGKVGFIMQKSLNQLQQHDDEFVNGKLNIANVMRLNK